MVQNLTGTTIYTSADSTYSFEGCVVDRATREVRLDGVIQSVAPRVFDLLAYLIENRDRVATKDELLDIVWNGADLSASVIARTVMKARYAIGDRADEPRLIRTVHRVGYRFVAPLSAGDGHEGALPLSPTTVPESTPGIEVSKLRLAVFPFQNLTGESRLDWMQLGLLSLVNQALEGDDRLHVASVSTVLKALEDSVAGTDEEAKARSLMELIGAQCVCCTAVSKGEHGFALDYHLLTAQGITHTGKMVASEPTALCELLVGSIEEVLFESEASALRLHSSDPWVNQAFARAVQALELMNAKSALKLIQVVLEVEPESLVVRFRLLQTLCQLRLPEALPLGKTILALALDASDLPFAAKVNALLATASFRLHGAIPASLRYADEAMRLAGPINDSYWVQQIYNDCAGSAYYMGEHERAIGLFEQVEAASRRTGNQKQWLVAIACRGAIEAIRGNLFSARDLLESALIKYEALNQKHPVMTIRNNLSELCAAMGLIDTAIHHCDMVVDFISISQLRWWTLSTVSSLCIQYAEARRPDKIEHALQVVGLLAHDTDEPELKHVMLADAQRHISKGELEFAGKKLRAAVDLAVQGNDREYATQWVPLLLHNSMRMGRYSESHALAAELISIPVIQDSADILGMSLHAQALDLHSRGAVSDARSKLSEAIALMHPGRWSIHVRLDAAWLDIERGDLSAARSVLVGTFSWLQSHPIGQFVAARLQFALGNRETAAVTFGRCSSFVQANDSFFAQLGQCYQQTDSLTAPNVPIAPRLPSVL